MNRQPYTGQNRRGFVNWDDEIRRRIHIVRAETYLARAVDRTQRWRYGIIAGMCFAIAAALLAAIRWL